jgi:hypothetical protein
VAGKGDDRRPSQVSEAEFDANWRSIFGSTERRRAPTGRRHPWPPPSKKDAREAAARRIGQIEMPLEPGQVEWFDRDGVRHVNGTGLVL